MVMMMGIEQLDEPCGQGSNIGETPSKKLSQEGCLPHAKLDEAHLQVQNASKLKSGPPAKVAFVQIWAVYVL